MGHTLTQWLWLAGSALATLAIVVIAVRERRRADRWEFAAKVAHADAVRWERVARHAAAANAFSRRQTIVAPQYHSPRG